MYDIYSIIAYIILCYIILYYIILYYDTCSDALNARTHLDGVQPTSVPSANCCIISNHIIIH